MKKIITLLIASLLLYTTIWAQKGIPPAAIANASVTTHFPQHEEFNINLVKRLKVPPGYTIVVAARGLGKPRMMAVTPNGSLLVTRRDQGDVLLLSDTDKDGYFDAMRTVVTEFKGVHGITIHDGFLYLCSNEELRKAKMNTDDEPGDFRTLLKDLPDGGQHGNRTLAVGPDGLLYISIGSSCNDCAETNPEHATMLTVDTSGGNRKIFARGLRNTIGFDWHPQTKELWGVDNGTDWRGNEIPPEELNHIEKDGDYGWPLVFGKQQPDPTREDPPGTTKAAYAKTTKPSIMEFPAHSAPINFIFLKSADSSANTADALVSWHGSWNKLKPDGFKVQRIRFTDGKPVSKEDFLSGFLSADGRTRFGRPAGIVQAANGTIYISDDANGIIYALQPNKQ